MGGHRARVPEPRRAVPAGGRLPAAPAVLDTWAGTPVNKPLRHSQLMLDLAGGWRHELTENKRSDARIFDLVRSLRVDEPDEMPLEEALQTARRLFPRKPGVPDTTLTISHAQRMAVNADANRRLAPANAQLVEPEEDPDTAEQNTSQPMRVWPGLKLIGAGGAIKKGTFVTVAACGENIGLESGAKLPDKLEVSGRKGCAVVPLQNVAADGGLKLGQQVKAHNFPAFRLEGSSH